MTRFALSIASFAALAITGWAAPAVPSEVFDLHEWKLQIPGPREIKQLQDYTSPYFHLSPEQVLVFHLDAAEKGTTENTKFVRSELRHLPEWGIQENRTLRAEFRATSSLQPDKLTVLQIHGILPSGGNAPPLLRIAFQDGDLFAMLKTDTAGEHDEKVLLKRHVGVGFENVVIVVRKSRLSISIGNSEKLDRDVSYWKYRNYFKAGAYPQATAGIAEVVIRHLSTE